MMMIKLVCSILFFFSIRLSIETTYTCNPSISCGCSINSTVVNRIVNGETAETNAWSWTVSLLIQNAYLCGGSILSQSWIITAAHCLYDVLPSEVVVHAGSNIRLSGNQIRYASRTIVHPNYSTSDFSNDIALIKLSTPLNMLSSNIRRICLPNVNLTILGTNEWPIANTTVVAVGWGRLSENGSSSFTLQQVTLNILDSQENNCQSIIFDPQVQLCASASNGTKDTCQGDSGGPLMMFSENRWILIGLTSYGEGCARADYAGVYTRVAVFQDWISSTMNTAHIHFPSTFFILCLLVIQK